MLQAELRLLDSIDWRLGVSSLNARSYLRCLIRDMGLSAEISLMATFISEIALHSVDSLRFTYYEQALGSIEVALLALWNTPFQKIMTCEDSQSIAILLLKGSTNITCNEFLVVEW